MDRAFVRQILFGFVRCVSQRGRQQHQVLTVGEGRLAAGAPLNHPQRSSPPHKRKSRPTGPQAPHTELAFLAKQSDARKSRAHSRALTAEWKTTSPRRQGSKGAKGEPRLVPVFQCQNKRYFDVVFHPFLDWYFSLRHRQGSLQAGYRHCKKNL